MEIEGGGTVRLRGGADMGSTVLVGMVRLKDTDLGGSIPGGEGHRACGEVHKTHTVH